MARYIDVEGYRKLFDEEYKKTRKLIFEGETHLDNLAEGFSEASRVIDRMPTADVAPRAEVAREIFEEIEEEIDAALESNYRALKEWDDGRCNDYILEMVNRIKGKIDALRGIAGLVEEIKKKYTEGET